MVEYSARKIKGTTLSAKKTLDFWDVFPDCLYFGFVF